MNRELTLFERMRDPDTGKKKTLKNDAEKLFNSVKEHLQKVLNTKQGHALVRPDYGMPDFTDFIQTLPDTVTEMETSIKNTIEKYEPRLKNIHVRFKPVPDNQFILNFEIMADIMLPDEQFEATFNTVVNSVGKIDVKG